MYDSARRYAYLRDIDSRESNRAQKPYGGVLAPTWSSRKRRRRDRLEQEGEGESDR